VIVSRLDPSHPRVMATPFRYGAAPRVGGIRPVTDVGARERALEARVAALEEDVRHLTQQMTASIDAMTRIAARIDTYVADMDARREEARRVLGL